MNNKSALFRNLAFCAALVSALFLLAANLYAQDKTNAAGEEFFIISSVDAPNSQILLKHASEVTQIMKVTPKTKYLDESGKAIRISDLRAGDTVWVLITKGTSQPTATRFRIGPMTTAELHRDYLDYPEIK